MKTSQAALILLLASSKACADKVNTLEASYTFSKVIVKRLPYINFDDLVSIKKNNNSESYYPNYSWGNQACLGYQKKLAQSEAEFVGHATFVHSTFSHNFFEPAGSLNEITLQSFAFKSADYGYPAISFVADSESAFSRNHGEFNYAGLDFSVRYQLLKTKHAYFSVQGGGLLAGFKNRTNINSFGNDLNNSADTITHHAKMYIRDVFTGPNIKILLESPFFNNSLVFNLNLGLGLMMAYETFYFRSYQFVEGLYKIKSSIDQSSKNQNNYRFCPQADLEASISFTMKNLILTGGLNQFCFVYNANRDRFSSVVFGGPFIKAGYEF